MESSDRMGGLGVSLCLMWRKAKARTMYKKLWQWGALAMLVAFIIMVLPSGVIVMISKKPEILVKTLNVRMPEMKVVYEKPKVGTSWEYEWGADSKSLCQNIQ